MASGEGSRGGLKVHLVNVSLLPSDCKEEEVRTVFATYGEVLSIQMFPPGPDGLSSATITYDSEEAAEDAEEVLDGQYSIRRDVNRPIRVKRQVPAAAIAAGLGVEVPPPGVAAPPAPERSLEGDGGNKFWTENGAMEAHKLWVGSLPPDITPDELKVVFSTYGTVLKVHIMPTLHRKGKSAFVLYSSRESAEDAIEVLDEAYRIRPNSPWPMQVRRANPSTPPVRASGAWGSGYEGGDAEWRDGWWGGGHSGDNWRGGWDGSQQESSWSGSGGKGRGKRRLERPCPNCSCIVTFELPEEVWHRGQGNDRPPQQQEAGEQPPEGAKGSAGAGAAPAVIGAAAPPAAPPGAAAAAPVPAKEGGRGRVHVFANLPANVDEKGLRWVFAQYGEVTSVHIAKDEADANRLQAWVDFADPYDAETSVMTLDGQYEMRSGFGPIRLKVTGAKPQPAPY